MRIAITGATGLIGRQVVAALKERGDEVTALSRDPRQGEQWDPMHEPAPAQALAGRDAIVHLAGENIAQRWSAAAKQTIRDSRVTGTRQLVRGIGELAEAERPRVLV
ncbi:MAG: NAD-dependent epimerase/dehydratase family protein, partial [Solirubrobacteraceae bacterium]